MTFTHLSKEIAPLEHLLCVAQMKGEFLRFPERFSQKPDIAGHVSLALTQCDNLGISFYVQNTILKFINNVDDQKYWQFLFKNQFKEMALKALNGDNLEVTL
jgi:hypothetical protein